MATTFGGKNPWPECNALLGSKVMQGSAGVNQRSNFLESMGTKFGRKNPSPDQRVTHCWDQRSCRGQARVNQRSNTLGDAGVIRGHSEGNCLEMRKAIKCSQCYRALCSCRCSSKVKNNWPHISKNFDFRRSITSLWKLLWVKTFQIWVSLNETFNLIYSFLCFD